MALDGKNITWDCPGQLCPCPRTRADKCYELIGRLYEKPTSKLTTDDVNLVKKALQHYANA